MAAQPPMEWSMRRLSLPSLLVFAALLIAVPAVLVKRQPDLGTAGMLLLVGAAMLFVAGVRWWKFALVSVAGIGSVPVIATPSTFDCALPPVCG